MPTRPIVLRPQLPKGASCAASWDLQRLAERLSVHGRTAILSGAGISTESGLSDYRSPGKARPPPRPTHHDDFVTSPHVRKRYWARSYIGFPLLCTARPNVAHRALSALHRNLESMFPSHVTQNVDGLLQVAGTRKEQIVELHGSIHSLTCMTCGTPESRAMFQTRLNALNSEWVGNKVTKGRVESKPDGDAGLNEEGLVESFQVPTCRGCGADTLKPDVVFHGGVVGIGDAKRAMQIVTDVDALLVVGSTVTPFSAFRLVKTAKEQGKFLASIGFGPTRADGLWDVKVDGLVGDAVRRLANLLLRDGLEEADDDATDEHNAEEGGKLQL